MYWSFNPSLPLIHACRRTNSIQQFVDKYIWYWHVYFKRKTASVTTQLGCIPRIHCIMMAQWILDVNSYPLTIFKSSSSQIGILLRSIEILLSKCSCIVIYHLRSQAVAGGRVGGDSLIILLLICTSHIWGLVCNYFYLVKHWISSTAIILSLTLLKPGFPFFWQVVVINKVAPPLAEDDLQRVIQPILTEYLEHGQTDEVIVRPHTPNDLDVQYTRTQCCSKLFCYVLWYLLSIVAVN